MAAPGNPPPGGGNQPPQRRNQQRQQGPQRGQGPFKKNLEIESLETVKLPNGEFDLDLTVFCTEGNRPLETDVDLYVDGTKRDTFRTGKDGRGHVIWGRIPADGNLGNYRTAVVVQIPGEIWKKFQTINLPHKEEKPAPKLAKIEAFRSKTEKVGDNFRHTITAIAVGEDGKGLKDLILTWTCGDKSGLMTTTGDAGKEGSAEGVVELTSEDAPQGSDALTCVVRSLSFGGVEPKSFDLKTPKKKENPKSALEDFLAGLRGE